MRHFHRVSLLFLLLVCLFGHAGAAQPDREQRAAAKQQLTRAYCEYQLAFVLLTYQVTEQDLERALTSARRKVRDYEAAYANAKAAGVPRTYELVCDEREGYGDYRGTIRKHLANQYDPPFKVRSFGSLRPTNPTRWLATYPRRHAFAQRMFPQIWYAVKSPRAARRLLSRNLSRDLFYFLQCRLRPALRGENFDRWDYTVSGFHSLRYSIYFARAAGLTDREQLSCSVDCGPGTCDGVRPLTLAKAMKLLPKWELQVKELVRKMAAADWIHWKAYLQRLKGDKLATFKTLCFHKRKCAITANGKQLATPEELAAAPIWITQEPLYHYIYKAYLFRGDKKVDEIETEYSPVPPGGSWGKLRRSAKQFAIRRRRALIPAE